MISNRDLEVFRHEHALTRLREAQEKIDEASCEMDTLTRQLNELEEKAQTTRDSLAEARGRYEAAMKMFRYNKTEDEICKLAEESKYAVHTS